MMCLWTEDYIHGREEVQRRFPAGVQAFKIVPVYWIRRHSCPYVHFPQSYRWRHLCQPAGFLANRMGSSTGISVCVCVIHTYKYPHMYMYIKVMSVWGKGGFLTGQWLSSCTLESSPFSHTLPSFGILSISISRPVAVADVKQGLGTNETPSQFYGFRCTYNNNTYSPFSLSKI